MCFWLRFRNFTAIIIQLYLVKLAETPTNAAVMIVRFGTTPKDVLRTLGMPSDAGIAAIPPRTPEEIDNRKQRSRMNSVKRSLYCDPAHLPAEDQTARARIPAELKSSGNRKAR